MAVFCRGRVLFLVGSVLACTLWSWSSPISAEESAVKGLLLTLNYPQRVQQPKPAAYPDIEKLLSEPLDRVEDRSHGSSRQRVEISVYRKPSSQTKRDRMEDFRKFSPRHGLVRVRVGVPDPSCFP